MAIMPDLSRRRLAGLLRRVQGCCPGWISPSPDYGTPADCQLTLDALRREDGIFLPLWEGTMCSASRSTIPCQSREGYRAG